VSMSKKHRILVVERTRTWYRAVTQALPRDEYEVVEASTPRVGRKKVAISSPSLALVSTDYENQDAYPFCTELAGNGVAVIVLETFPSKYKVVKAARHGALDVLIPPPQADLIVSRVRKALVKTGKALPQPHEAPKIQIPGHTKDPRSRVEYVLKKAQDIVALPHAVSAVLRLCAQQDTGASDVLVPVKSDGAITARALRYANVVSQASLHQITDLQAAIARLGMRATANMALTQSVFNMFEREGDTFGFDRTEYWVHSLGTACCARALAASLWDEIDPDDAFLSGLLHDVGKMLLDEYLPLEYQQAVKDANMEGTPVRLGELKQFRVDHTYVGAQIAQHWRLPEHVRRAIADHHKYENLLKTEEPGTPEERDLLAITRCTCLANQLAKAFGFGNAGDSLVETESLNLWSKLDGVNLDFPKLYSGLRDDLGEFLDLLEISSDELRLEFGESGSERVLLCLPEEEPQYRIPLEAFFAHLGCSTVTRPTLEHTPEEGAPFAMGVTSVSGTLDDVKKAADMLILQVQRGVVFTDCPGVTSEPLKLNDKITVVRRLLDFHVLNELVGETLSPSDSSS